MQQQQFRHCFRKGYISVTRDSSDFKVLSLVLKSACMEPPSKGQSDSLQPSKPSKNAYEFIYVHLGLLGIQKNRQPQRSRMVCWYHRCKYEIFNLKCLFLMASLSYISSTNIKLISDSSHNSCVPKAARIGKQLPTYLCLMLPGLSFDKSSRLNLQLKGEHIFILPQKHLDF